MGVKIEEARGGSGWQTQSEMRWTWAEERLWSRLTGQYDPSRCSMRKEMQRENEKRQTLQEDGHHGHGHLRNK